LVTCARTSPWSSYGKEEAEDCPREFEGTVQYSKSTSIGRKKHYATQEISTRFTRAAGSRGVPRARKLHQVLLPVIPI